MVLRSGLSSVILLVSDHNFVVSFSKFKDEVFSFQLFLISLSFSFLKIASCLLCSILFAFDGAISIFISGIRYIFMKLLQLFSPKGCVVRSGNGCIIMLTL